jgi:hydrogenase assembly chaperone HypC/HupF
MCIGIPMLVETVDGLAATCSAGGVTRAVILLALEEAPSPGDWLLVQQTFAIRRIDAAEAALIWDALDQALGAEPSPS